MDADLSTLFEPAGIALIGASADPTKRAGKPLRYLMHWFDRPVYPVNPNRDTVADLKAYDSVTDIPNPVDVAIVTLPASLVADVIRECGEAGVDHAIVISAGFAETDSDGEELQRELARVAEQTGVRIVGPNSFGVINCANGMVASIMTPDMDSPLPDGPSALISQSGGVVTTLLDAAQTRSIGIRNLVSTGNEMDIKNPEYLTHVLKHSKLNVIATYVEGLDDSRQFMDAAETATDRETPIVALKGGRSEPGSKSAQSHTASMTGNYDVFKGACEQTNVLTVDSAYELIDCCQLFQEGHYEAKRIGAVSDSGSGAVSMGDHIASTGLEFREFAAETKERLTELGGSRVHPINPFDLAAAIDIDQYEEVIRAVATDDNVDVVLWYSAWNGEDAIECARAIERGAAAVDVPVLVVWPVPRQRTNGAKSHLEQHDVPVFPSVERAISALDRMHWYHSRVTNGAGRSDGQWVDTPSTMTGSDNTTLPTDELLTEVRSKEFLREQGIPVPDETLVSDETAAVERARELGSRVVLKVVSPDIPHRSDHRLVEIGVPTGTVGDVYNELIDRAQTAFPEASIEGVLVQEYVDRPGAVELLIGSVNDSVFGPTVMIAPGSVCAELSENTVHRVAPFGADVAVDMVDSLGLEELAAGKASVSRECLTDVVTKIGRLAAENPEISELDCNPVIVTEDDAIVVDALIRT